MTKFIERLERDDFRKVIIPLFTESAMLILFLLAVGIQYLIYKKTDFTGFLIIFYVVRVVYLLINSSLQSVYRELLKNERMNLSSISLRKYTEELKNSQHFYFSWISLFFFLLFFAGYVFVFGNFLDDNYTIILGYCVIIILNIHKDKHSK